jgi:hypothetical protein
MLVKPAGLSSDNEVTYPGDQGFSRPDGKFCLGIRYGTSSIIDGTVPFAPHPVEGGGVGFVKVQAGEFHDRYMLVRPVRAVTVRKHQCPAGLENGIVGDRVCPVTVCCEKCPGKNKIAVREAKCIADLFLIDREFLQESLAFKLFNHRRYR